MSRLRVVLITMLLLFVFQISPLLGKSTEPILKGLSAPDFKSMLDTLPQSGVILLDIRTPAEFAGGHIQGAVSIDYYDQTFVDRLKTLDRQQTYLIYCRSGNRTGRSLATFAELGFSRVYHLESGIIGWTRENYPLVR